MKRSPIDSSAPIIGELVGALDILALARQESGALRAIGEAPQWWCNLYPQIDPELYAEEFNSHCPFLANFLIDAEEFWATPQKGRLKSGTWYETGANGEDLHLDASALNLGGHNVLIVELLNARENERQVLIQTGRENILQASREISAQKRTAEQMRQARDEAESLNQAKSLFLANMSHEIRTPMNGIIGMAQLMANTELSLEQRDFLGAMNQSAHSLLNIVNDILDLSKIESGKVELEQEPFSLRECIGSALHISSLKAEEKNLQLVYRVAADIPESLSGDPFRLRQIVTNLVTNAVKFTETGEIKVIVERLADDGAEVKLRLAVTDTGIGIAEEKKRDIFAAFTQADSSVTRRFGGTGLGLTIAANLTHLMGGEISVESEVGTGSTFSCTLCFGHGPTETAVALPPHLEGTSALIVSDNDTMRQYLLDLCRSWQLQPRALAATTLADLQRLIGDGDYGLVLIDGHMSLAREVGRDQRFANARKLLLLSTTQVQQAPLASSMGIDASIIKPITPGKLLEAALDTAADAIRTSQVTQQPQPAFEGRPLKILLAEDQLINQKVATRLLERQGHEVHAVDNGKVAVQRAKQERFDLVLMDVQMPEMDGFEATDHIRQREAREGGHLPIIGLTAHAMRGYRERCLDAGMDDYITKPIDANELFAAISRHAVTPSIEELAPPAADTENCYIDEEVLLANFAGDREFIGEALVVFWRGCDKTIEELRTACAARDYGQIARLAHTLKGTIGNWTRTGPFAIAQKLEAMAIAAETSPFGEMCAQLEKDLEHLRLELSVFE